ncbi:putative zinc- or iron-chelating protein [Geothermobacter ehrlichii]|uniref:Putative zinc-or iron-chelating protein n=1 Tax=Geothermobacter ehrlichii TaxID=213224 RepID=A0A5D3WJ11_9BACT|nr:YkgJ family cysteine cluster protein [Geothermobacter ehrlichii]TYO98261.1 putative zinc- or iron-chelating protein [Geothermobacter ehrlichii]
MGLWTRLKEICNRLGQKEETACLACGDCCRRFSWHLHASPRDIRRWRQAGRDDILAHVHELGMLWFDPDSGERLECCPFLVADGPDRAICGIHEVKPDICRAYPTLEHNRSCLKGTFLD